MKYSFKEEAIGMDGEFFLVDADANPVSSIGIIGGEKGYPEECEGGGYLEDCVAVEVNTVPVPRSEGPKKFADNILSCINAVERKIAPLNLSVSIEPEKLFPPSQLSSKKANESGCAPSHNIWTRKNYGNGQDKQGRDMEKVVDLDTTPWRFASGDLHLSWPINPDRQKANAERVNTLRLLDIIMTLNEVAFSPINRRREGYGQPGMCRPTPYGVEYKAASNFWMRSREEMEWAFEVGMWVIDTVTDDLRYIDDGPERTLPLIRYDKMGDRVNRIKAGWDRSAALDLMGAYCPPPHPKFRGTSNF